MRFSKWHAHGNTYLLIERDDLTPALVRRHAKGSDGILEVLASGPDWARVRIWNPDGTTAELSGNGTRIVARWLAEGTGAERVRVRVGPREVAARMLSSGEVEQQLGAVEVGAPELLEVGEETIEITPVSVGNPHAVVFREPDEGELLRLGPLIGRHPRFPGGTNVQLARVDGPHELSVAVWERGAGRTSSSGTSAVAAAAAAIARGDCASPVAVRMPGGALRVEIDAEHQALLTGPAVEVPS